MDILEMIEQALEVQKQDARIRAQAQAWKRKVRPFRAIARQILVHFNLEQYTDRFLSSPDGLALLANCCNCAAKWYDDALYQHKPTLINLATSSGIECWQADGIVYIETSIGQVSFHALYGEDEGLPEANGRVWSEMEMQFNAPLVAKAWLHGWSKCALKQILVLSSAAEEIAA